MSKVSKGGMRVSEYLDPSFYPREAIEAIRKIEQRAGKQDGYDVNGFRIKFFSDTGRLIVEERRSAPKFKGFAKK